MRNQKIEKAAIITITIRIIVEVINLLLYVLSIPSRQSLILHVLKSI